MLDIIKPLVKEISLEWRELCDQFVRYHKTFLKELSLQCWIKYGKMCDRFVIVYVEWASRVNFVTIFGDLYQNKLWVI